MKGHEGERYKGFVTTVSFSPDNKTLLSAGGYHEDLLLWSVETGELLRTLQDDKAPGFSNAAFSPDGRLVVGAASGGPVILWDVQTGERIRAHEGGAFDFLPDGKTLAISGDDGVYLWDLATGDSTGKIEMNKNISDLSFSPDGKTLAVLFYTKYAEPIELWDVETGTLMKTLPSPDDSLGIAFSPDGKTLASSGLESHIQLWNTDTGELIDTVGEKYGQGQFAFSPDGTTLASGADDDIHLHRLKND